MTHQWLHGLAWVALVAGLLSAMVIVAEELRRPQHMWIMNVSGRMWAAIKADTLSLTAWQLGMYGWMAIASFLIFGM